MSDQRRIPFAGGRRILILGPLVRRGGQSPRRPVSPPLEALGGGDPGIAGVVRVGGGEPGTSPGTLGAPIRVQAGGAVTPDETIQ